MTENYTTTGPTPATLKTGLGDSDAQAVLNGPEKDASACRKVLSGELTPDEARFGLSTSQAITVALAFGREDLLPASHRDFRACWRRLDNRQRSLVDVAARAKWKTNYESPPVGW